MVRALWPPLSCSLVIVKRRHAGWHDAEGPSGRLDVVSVPDRKVWAAPLDRRGVGKHVSCDLNGLWTRLGRPSWLNRVDRDPCSWSVF